MADLTFPTLSASDQLSTWDTDLNTALSQVRTFFAIDGSVTNPVAYQAFLDTDDQTFYQRNAGNSAWIKLYTLGSGKTRWWADDAGTPKHVGLSVPATLTDSYEVVWPVDIATTGEAMRVASVTSGVLQLEWFSPGAGASTLAGLTDVDTTGVSDGDVLTYDSAGSDWVPAAPSGGASALSDLSDATVTTPSDRHVLIYDTSAFVNRALVSADLPDLSSSYLAASSGLGDLADVSIGAASSGDSLEYNGSNWVPVDYDTTYLALSGGTLTGNLILDGSYVQWKNSTNFLTLTATPTASYSITLPPEGPGGTKILQFTSGGVASWVDPQASSADDLSDVTITTPSNRHVLIYDTSAFVNRALVEADLPDLSGTYLELSGGTTSGAVTFGDNITLNATNTFSSSGTTVVASTHSFRFYDSVHYARIQADTLTAARTLELPNLSGVLAVKSQVIQTIPVRIDPDTETATVFARVDGAWTVTGVHAYLPDGTSVTYDIEADGVSLLSGGAHALSTKASYVAATLNGTPSLTGGEALSIDVASSVGSPSYLQVTVTLERA